MWAFVFVLWWPYMGRFLSLHRLLRELSADVLVYAQSPSANCGWFDGIAEAVSETVSCLLILIGVTKVCGGVASQVLQKFSNTTTGGYIFVWGVKDSLLSMGGPDLIQLSYHSATQILPPHQGMYPWIVMIIIIIIIGGGGHIIVVGFIYMYAIFMLFFPWGGKFSDYVQNVYTWNLLDLTSKIQSLCSHRCWTS